MRWVKSWMLAVVTVLALGAAVLAVDYATRDDAGDTAYQGMGTGGEGAPIQITANEYGHVWTTSITEVAAVLGNGFPLRLTFADPAADTYTAAQAVTTARTRVRAVAGTSGLVVSFDGGTTDHLTVLPNTEIEMGLPIGAGVTIAVKRYTAGTAFTHAIMEVR